MNGSIILDLMPLFFLQFFISFLFLYQKFNNHQSTDHQSAKSKKTKIAFHSLAHFSSFHSIVTSSWPYFSCDAHLATILMKMFRPKKKAKRNIRTKHTDKDDEEEHLSSIKPKQNKKKRKAKAVVIRSFAEDEPDSPRKPKNRGFGGISSSYYDADKDNIGSEQTDTFTRYSRNEIDKLKEEQAKLQKRYKEEKKQDKQPEGKEDHADDVHNADDKESLKISSPLKHVGFSALEQNILTGEEAENVMQPQHNLENDKHYEEKERLLSLNTENNFDSNMDNNIDDGGWESQIAQRAGISLSTALPKRGHNTKSLEKLRGQISDAMKQLSLELGDINQLSKLRMVELRQCQTDVDKHKGELQQAGNQLDYYQELRIELASWAGALRELSVKIQPIKEATKELHQLRNPKSEWTHWENDAVFELSKTEDIQVLGRKSPVKQEEKESKVDEFGRNVKSKAQLERESRHRIRDLCRAEKSLQGYESDALILLSQEREWRDREEALQKAMAVATEALEQTYRCPKNLISIFSKWKKRYPEDYRNCHAGMSLADLVAILLKAEINSNKFNHPLYFQKSKSTLIPIMEMVKNISSDSQESIPKEDTPLYRIMDKVLIPTFEETLCAYNILSSCQSDSMASYYLLLLEYIPLPNIMMDKLTKQFIECCRENLSGIAIPLINPNKKKPESWNSDLEQEAHEYATKIQKVRIQKILVTLFDYWVPVLGDSLADPILDFTSTQFLYLCLESDKEIFVKIWEKIECTNWLSQPHHMVVAAPLKAAASHFLANTRTDDV